MARKSSKPAASEPAPEVTEPTSTAVETPAESPAKTPPASKQVAPKEPEDAVLTDPYATHVANVQGMEPDPAPTPPPSEEGQEPAVEEGTEPSGDTGEEPTAEPTPEPLAVPGVSAEDSARYVKEITEGGQLTEDSYKELAEAGYPKQVVDQFIAGQQGAVDHQAKLYEALGGKDTYEQQIIPWAQATLDPASIEEFDKVMASGDISAATAAAEALVAEFRKDRGMEPGASVGGMKADAFGAIKPFRSQKELRDAMADPAFKTNHTYRMEVQERANVSRRAGIQLS